MSSNPPFDAQAVHAWDDFQALTLNLEHAMEALMAPPVRAVTAPSLPVLRPSLGVGAIRVQAGLSQILFAQLLGVSVRTLQEWEQGRRTPSGAAQTLLLIAQRHPQVLHELLR